MKDKNKKKPLTMSQVLRAELYVLWEEDHEGMTSEEFYIAKMRAFIEFTRAKIASKRGFGI